MTARITLSTLVGLLVCGFTVTPATAADYGISFHYGSYTPYRTSTSYYSTCYPGNYVYYGNYCEPAVYVGCSTPRAIVYDDCYPTTYRTTYTRSRRYTRPVRRGQVSVQYRSGHSTRHYRTQKTYSHHYRKSSTYRHHYSKPRSGLRISINRNSSSRCRIGDSYNRHRGTRHYYRDHQPRYRSSHHRHHRTPRVRIIRR